MALKLLVILFSYICYYIAFEVLFNAIARLFNWYNTIEGSRSKWTLEGSASLYVGLMGGLTGFGLYGLFNIPVFMKPSTIFIYAIISGLLITINELFFGWLLNLKLKLNLWDYSNEPLNVKGQISLFRFLAWCLLGLFIYFLNKALFLI